MTLILEQILNGLQLGVTLFLLASGLTLIFGIMRLINLAHGALYMLGAYLAAFITKSSGSFLVGALGALIISGAVGVGIEILIIRRLYHRNHLYQVLAMLGLIMWFNELMVVLFGRQPLFMDTPALLSGAVTIIPGVPYPSYRIFIIAVGLLISFILYFLITRTRVGMLIRAGSTNRDIVEALGVDIRLLYTLVFGFGACLAGLAGIISSPLVAVEVGMGEQIIILTFVTIVVGGTGSVRGAFAGALLVGMVDTMGRAFLPSLLKLFLPPAEADGIGAGLASMSIYILMAAILIFRPKGLIPAYE